MSPSLASICILIVMGTSYWVDVAPSIVEKDSAPRYSFATTTASRASERREGAMNLLRNERYEEAYRIFQEVIDENPDDYIAHTNLASCLMKMDGSEYGARIDMSIYDTALRHFRIANDLRPDIAATWSNLGSHLLAGGTSLNVAETCFRRAIALEEDNLSHVLSLGAALEASGRVEEAIRTYRQGLERAPAHTDIRAELWSNLGTSLFAMNSHKESIAAFRSALRIDPSLTNARTNLHAVLERVRSDTRTGSSSPFASNEDDETVGVGTDCSAEREWAGSVAWRRKCRAPSLSHDSEPPDASPLVSLPSSFGHHFQGTMYVFETNATTMSSSRSRWYAKEEDKTYAHVDASEDERVLRDRIQRLVNDAGRPGSKLPKIARDLLASCASYARRAPSVSSFVYVGRGRDARGVVESTTCRNVRLYCTVDARTMRAVTFCPTRPEAVDEKEYVLVTNVNDIRNMLEFAESIHSSLSILREALYEVDDRLSVWHKASQSGTRGVDIGSPLFAHIFRRVWYSLDPEAASRVSDDSIQRIQYGTTTTTTNRHYAYVTFYHRARSTSDREATQSIEMKDGDPFRALKAMSVRGDLDALSSAARLALAQDLTIRYEANHDETASTYREIERHVETLSSLFAKEASVLSRLGPRAQGLRRVVSWIRDVEGDAMFTTRRMAMVDAFRSDTTNESYDRVFGIPVVSSRRRSSDSLTSTRQSDGSLFSLDNFMYGVVFVHGLKSFFKLSRPVVRAVHLSRQRDSYFLMLGSNVGTEAFFAALWLRLRTVGVDILCGLVDEAQRIRTRSEIPRHILRFECGDASDEKILPDSIVSAAGVVYVDDATWDLRNIHRVATRLAMHLSSDAIVITFRPNAFLSIRGRGEKECFEHKGASHVIASWGAYPDGLVPIAMIGATGLCGF